MDDSNPKPHSGTTPEKTVQADTPGARALEAAFARGSGHMNDAPAAPERREHSVMEGLPEAKIERIASIYRDLAELQRQLSAAQQRIATEIQGRAEDADRFEALEARLQAHEQDTTRVAALDAEIASLRSQLASATATAEAAEELRRELATRDAQIEQAGRQHQDAMQQLEVQSASLRDAKTLVETRDAELATRTSERDTELATRSKLERDLEDERKLTLEALAGRETENVAKSKLGRELEDERKQHVEVLASRDTELAAMTAERDAVKRELEQARSEFEAGRAKAREVASQLMRFGQELDGAGIAVPYAERPSRTMPPPIPSTRPSAPIDVQKVDTILEVTEEPTPAKSRLRSGLLILGGVILGCAATIAIVKATEPSNAAGYEADLGGSHSSALPTEPASQRAGAPLMREPSAEATAPSEQPNAVETTQPPASTEKTTDGVIVLPEAAAGHRVFVDDRVVEVKGSRAVVSCGTHDIRIGGKGTARKIDVACGSETAIPAEMSDR